MGRVARTLAGLVLVGMALTACDADAEPAPTTPGMTVLAAEVVEFDASGFYGPPFAAVVDSAAAAKYFPGWFAARDARSAAVPEVVRHPERLADLGTNAYIALVTSTGCRLPDRTELHRIGTALQPALLGGIDRPECVRAYTPFVVYKVRRADIAGVTDLAGGPVDRDGPGELVGRLELASTASGFAPRVVTDAGQRTALADELGGDTAKIRALLDGTSRLSAQYGGNGVRRYAFPVRACADDELALSVTATELRAEASARADAPRTCAAPTPHLAVFDIRETYVADGARPVA